jgi:hypothetical protein
MHRSDTISMLEAWAAWARHDDPRLWYRAEAGSAEGRYLAEAGDVLEDDRRPQEVTIADDEARHVERAVLAAGRRHAALLTLIFVHRLPPAIAIRKLRLPADPRLVLDSAVRAVADRLQGRAGSVWVG